MIVVMALVPVCMEMGLEPSLPMLKFDPSNVFETSGCKQFCQIWNSWRGKDIMPNRADDQMSQIKNLLPSMMILEVRSKSEAVFRLVGTLARTFIGTELTGNNIVEMASGDDRERRGKSLYAQTTQPCASSFHILNRLSNGFEIVIEIALFPIQPALASKRFQLIGVFQPLSFDRTSQYLDLGIEDIEASKFSFLDIGAGTPKAI